MEILSSIPNNFYKNIKTFDSLLYKPPIHTHNLNLDLKNTFILATHRRTENKGKSISSYWKLITTRVASSNPTH